MARLKRSKGKKSTKSPQAVAEQDLILKAIEAQARNDYPASIRYNQEIVRLNPENDTALNNIGACYYNMRQFQNALDYYKKAELISRKRENAIKMIGLCYTRLERFQEAEVYLAKAYQNDKDDSEILNWLVFALNKNGKPKEVLAVLQSVKPDKMTAEIYSDYMDAFIALDRKDEAVSLIEKAIENESGDIKLFTLLGKAYFEKRDHEKSVEAYKKVYDANPHDLNAVSNYALGLSYFYKFEEALSLFEKLLETIPHDYRIYANMANTYRMLGNIEKAIECAETAQKIAPDGLTVNYAVGIFNMMAENYEDGWVNTEYFWHVNKEQKYKPDINALNWYGENLSRKRLTIYADQGVGDTVLFLRYAPMILKKYPDCNMTIIAEKKLEDVVRSTLRDIPFHYLTKNQKMPSDFVTDYIVAASTLPYVFKTDIHTVPEPYKTIKRKRKLNYKQDQDDFVIGLSWYTKSSDAGHKRSIDLREFQFLADFPNVKIVNLQYGDTQAERDACGFEVVHDDTVDCWNSLQDHVDQIHACDLVISVDNTTAHVAGSIGKPVWTILPFDCYWRCWHLDHVSTPWYPSMYLFRQDQARSYKEVLKAIQKKLYGVLHAGESLNNIPAFLPKKIKENCKNDKNMLIMNHMFAGASWADNILSENYLETLKADCPSICIETLDRLQIMNATMQVPTLKDFDDPKYLSEYRFQDPNVFDRIDRMDEIILHAGYDMNGLTDYTTRLLYLAYVAKKIFRKTVSVDHFVCLPEGNTNLTDPNIIAFYRKVYLLMDKITVTDKVSHFLLEQLRIPCVLRNFEKETISTDKDKIIILADLPEMTPDVCDALNKVIGDYITDNGSAILLAGGPYFNAMKFEHYKNYLAGYCNFPMNVHVANTAEDWSVQMEKASLCVTGKYNVTHHNAIHNIPTIALSSFDDAHHVIAHDNACIATVLKDKDDCVASFVITAAQLLKNA